jgi:hypothetical protein
MSISPVMIKVIRHIALIFCVMGIGTVAHAQFVAIRLELPAGVNFNAQVVGAMAGGTWENNKAKVWIGIEASENLSFLLDLELPEGKILPPPEAYFLNDGSSDFEQASNLKWGVQELQLITPSKLIRNIVPKTNHLQAWLGLPILKGVSVKIEYP